VGLVGPKVGNKAAEVLYPKTVTSIAAREVNGLVGIIFQVSASSLHIEYLLSIAFLVVDNLNHIFHVFSEIIFSYESRKLFIKIFFKQRWKREKSNKTKNT
jgi:hypothetical protein